MFKSGMIACAAITITAGALFASSVPAAAGGIYMVNISNAMASPDFAERIDPSIRLYFGTTPHPRVLKNFGAYPTNEKTNAVMKSDRTACDWVFLSALKKLQERAHVLGANAVINIHSYYDKEDVSSDTQVTCHSGAIMAGVALRGEFVTLAGH
jgi:hypothetical protein